MPFESDYNKLIYYAKMQVRLLNLRADASDLVNDAYLSFEQEYSLSAFEKQIRSIAYKTQGEESQYQEWGTRPTSIKGEVICNICKESLPANAFYYNWNETNKEYTISSACKKCASCIKRSKAKSIVPKENKGWSDRKNYYSQNKEHIKAKFKEWYALNKEKHLAKKRKHGKETQIAPTG